MSNETAAPSVPPDAAIRPVGIEAVAEIAALHARCLAPAWGQAMVAPYLEDEVGFVLLAESDSDAAKSRTRENLGFLICRVVEGEAELLAMGVVPEARRLRLGTALLTAGMAEAARRGATRMFLEVAEDNPAAQGLYESQGFQPVGRRQAYYRTAGGAVGALVMECVLAGMPRG